LFPYFGGQMMWIKKILPPAIALFILSCLSGYLMSKTSWIGKMGIHFFYKEYRFLKTWWQGALLVFVVLFFLLLLQAFVQRRLPKTKANIVHGIFIVGGLVGLYLTYRDFQHTLTHRLLKERFHIGVYLFWIGWLGISIFYIVQKRTAPVAVQTETV
jgi:di/tricarboxylate transporter